MRGDVLMERGSTEVVTFRNAAQTVARTLLKPFFKETVMLLLPRALYCLIALAIGAAVTAPARSQAAHLAHPSSMPASPKPPSKQVLALFDAAERGATPKVKALLDKGVSAKVQAPNGLTPLILASMMNHPDTVKLLLDRGADVNAALRPGGYIGGSTPLIMAASGFTNILAGAKTPPAPPGYEGHEIEFMKKHPGLVKKWEAQTDTWSKGYGVIVGMLTARGADVNAQTTGGMTAIAAAATSGDLETVKLLLDKGARLDLPTYNRAYRSGKPLESTSGYEALTGATSMDQHSPELIKLLLAHGAKPNAVSSNDLTPLGRAAQGGDAQVVQLLLDAGADVNSYDGFGRTALMLAQRNKHADVVALLDKAGAKSLPQGPHDEVTIRELGQRPNGEKVMRRTETSTQVTVTRVVPKPKPEKPQGH